MKKFLLFSTIVVFFCSCRTIKGIIQTPSAIKQIDFALKGVRMAKKTEKTYHYGKKSPFVFAENAIFIPCKINDTIHLVYYDSEMSGVSITHGLLQEKIPGNVELPKSVKTIKLREKKKKNNSNHRIVVKSGVKYYDIESDFFYLKNLMGVVTSLSNDTIISTSMPEKNQNRFTIGDDVLPKWKDVMLLSFSDTTITLLDSVAAYDTTGFTFVKSLLNTCEGLVLCLTIDSIEYAFVFNTGFNGYLSMPQYAEHRKYSFVDGEFKCDNFYVQYEKHKKEDDTTITIYREQNYSEIINGITTAKYKKQNYSKTVIDTLIVQQTNAITIGDLDFIAGNIIYKKNSTRPIVGMQFISHFDWIIDMYRQKIYVKQINSIEFK